MNYFPKVVIIFILSGIFSNTNVELKVGESAPDFSLKDQDGVIHKLSDYRGKQVVIYFFPKAGTPGWIKEACGFRNTYFEFEKQGIIVFGISYDSQKTLKKFKANYNIPFLFLSDRKKVVSKQYGTKGFLFPSRKTFVIDKNGKLMNIFNNVDVHTHAAEILKLFSKEN